jgi:hypothetical protein
MRPRTAEEITAEWSSAVQLHIASESGETIKKGMKPLEWEIFVRILTALAPNEDESGGMVAWALEDSRKTRLAQARSDLMMGLFLDESRDWKESDVTAVFYRLRALARAFVPEVERKLPIMRVQRMDSVSPEDDLDGRPSIARTPVVPQGEVDPRAVPSGYPTMQAPYDEKALADFRDPNMSLAQMTRERLLAPSQPLEQAPDLHPSLHPAIPPPASLPAPESDDDDGPLITVGTAIPSDTDLDEFDALLEGDKD